jgi:hypothetical protein
MLKCVKYDTFFHWHLEFKNIRYIFALSNTNEKHLINKNNMNNTKLIRAMHILLNDLAEDAAERMREELGNDGVLVDVDTMQSELNFLSKCQLASDAIEVEDCDVEAVDLEFIKQDQGNKETLRTLLNDLFSEAEEDFGDEYVDKIVQLVFEKHK